MPTRPAPERPERAHRQRLGSSVAAALEFRTTRDPEGTASDSYAARVLAVLSGGVGAAKLLAGMVQRIDPAELTAIVNVGDDLVVHGLRVCPDLDTILYTLAGLNNATTGWGMAGESWRVMDELDHLGSPTWFRLGDRDLATHLYRTGRLDDGVALSAVTAELCAARGIAVRLLPATDDRVATVLTTRSGHRLSFQEYFVRERHAVEVAAIDVDGAHAASPAPGVLEALSTAERVVLAPSNPLLSIDPILAVPKVRAALAARRDDAVAISPIVVGSALKGPADRLLRELGHDSSALGVARLYRELVGTFVLDERDADLRGDVEALGLRCLVTDTVMADAARAAALGELVARG